MMLNPINNLTYKELMMFTILGCACTTFVKQFIKFIGYRNSISNIKSSKIITLAQINALHQNTTKIIKLTCQNSTTRYFRHQMGTNHYIFGIYPLRSIVRQQMNYINQHQNTYRMVVDGGKTLKGGRIVNQNVLDYQFKYSSVYDDQDTAPGILHNIFIGAIGVFAAIFEIVLQVLQPSYVEPNIKFKGPTIGWIETAIKLLTNSPLLAECKIQNGEIQPILIGLTRNDLIKYYQQGQSRSLFFIAVSGAFCYFMFRKSWKSLVKRMNDFLSYGERRMIQNNKLSVKVDDQLNCIICYNKCRNIIFKKCKHLAVCYQCFETHGDSLNKCPLCREDIQGQIVNVYDCDAKQLRQQGIPILQQH